MTNGLMRRFAWVAYKG